VKRLTVSDCLSENRMHVAGELDIPALAPNTSLRKALKVMDSHAVDDLQVFEQTNYFGVVTRQSIVKLLLLREHQLRKAMRKLQKDLNMEDSRRARQQLNYMAHFDELTSLPNKTLLKDRVQQAIAHAQRNHCKIGLLFLDLDNFKVVNDTIGHSLGDLLLKNVAQRLVLLFAGWRYCGTLWWR